MSRSINLRKKPINKKLRRVQWYPKKQKIYRSVLDNGSTAIEQCHRNHIFTRNKRKTSESYHHNLEYTKAVFRMIKSMIGHLSSNFELRGSQITIQDMDLDCAAKLTEKDD